MLGESLGLRVVCSFHVPTRQPMQGNRLTPNSFSTTVSALRCVASHLFSDSCQWSLGPGKFIARISVAFTWVLPLIVRK